MQARKIGEYRQTVDWLIESDATRLEKITGIVTLLEEKDKEAAYQIQKFLPHSQAIRALFNDSLIRFCSRLIGGKPETTLLDGPALFANKPSVKRLLYKPHTEAAYYGKRRKFCNIWLPIFRNRTIENGTMTVWPGSHKRAWHTSEMVEYVGFNPGEEKSRNAFKQIEVPRNFLSDWIEQPCIANRGDMIIFDRNLIHSSNANISDEMSFAIVCRVWDPSDDLTISGHMECEPYGGNQGRANLVVTP
jgi:ectoine hydroxylase-related dioxygenase (phytanoyl-CoA dioxygenase family)